MTKQQMALSSLQSGKTGEEAVQEIFTRHGWTLTTGKAARIPDPTGTNLTGFLHPDMLASKGDYNLVVEVKSNGPAKGTMYNKWVYQALRHSFTGKKTLFVFNLAVPAVFIHELRFLRQAVPSMNLEYVLIEELEQWLIQK